MNNLKSLAVYCGSASGSQPVFADATRATAEAMVSRGVDLVYGGGRLGLMGLVADTTLQLGGRVYGVIPQALVDIEVAHPGLTELHTVANMHERKAKMTDLADAFLALPGGIGTLRIVRVQLCDGVRVTAANCAQEILGLNTELPEIGTERELAVGHTSLLNAPEVRNKGRRRFA